jgi:hypothetical protein
MVTAAIMFGIKYGPAMVGAVYSFLAHRKSKQNHKILTGQNQQ